MRNGLSDLTSFDVMLPMRNGVLNGSVAGSWYVSRYVLIFLSIFLRDFYSERIFSNHA